MDTSQQRAVLTLCLMAAFADGSNDDSERAEIRRIAAALGTDSSIDVNAIYQSVLLQKPALATVVARR